MDIYKVLERYAELKSSQDGKKYNYSRARLKSSYDQYVSLWRSHYSGNVDGINTTYGYNGLETFPVKRQSMRLAKIISEKWSTGLFTEKFAVTLKDDIETEKFRELEKQINFRSKLVQAAISGYALGTSALLASADLITNTENGEILSGKVKLDVIKYDFLYPIVFDSNDIKTIAFVKSEQSKDITTYTISIHTLENGKTTVENIIATVKGEKVDFTSPETVKQVQVFNNRQYAWIRPNTINDYSDVLPFGQSIFADALAPIIDVDLASNALRRDVEEGDQVTFIGKDLILDQIGKNGNKKTLFENTRGKFFVIPQKLGEQGNSNIKQLFEKSVPEIRSTAFWEVVKNALNWACMTSGLGKNTLDVIPQQTATGVIHTESEKMQNVSLHQQYLENQIIQLVKALCELSTLTGKPIDAETVNITWEDTIIQDITAEKRQALCELDAGILSPVEFRMRFYGETEDTAKTKLAAMKDREDPFRVPRIDDIE